jgi:hypothetical protein
VLCGAVAQRTNVVCCEAAVTLAMQTSVLCAVYADAALQHCSNSAVVVAMHNLALNFA